MNPVNASRQRAQSGIVLPIVLIFLVVMTLIGITAIRNVTLEERMAGNSRDQQLAFQAAEEALRFCERQILDKDIEEKYYGDALNVPVAVGSASSHAIGALLRARHVGAFGSDGADRSAVSTRRLAGGGSVARRAEHLRGASAAGRLREGPAGGA